MLYSISYISYFTISDLMINQEYPPLTRLR
nr:MAG TPA: hypothetical protein [Caudoviricetes sp.]